MVRWWGLIGNWLYILPTGSPGSYSLSHTGDTYLSLRSLNGEGLSITSSMQPQVCTEGSCRVGLNAVNPVNHIPRIPTFSVAPFDLDPPPPLNPDPTYPLTTSVPHPTQTSTLRCTVNQGEDTWPHQGEVLRVRLAVFPSYHALRVLPWDCVCKLLVVPSRLQTAYFPSSARYFPAFPSIPPSDIATHPAPVCLLIDVKVCYERIHIFLLCACVSVSLFPRAEVVYLGKK